MDPELIQEAHAAIAAGADPTKVAARFRELAGADLPSPAVAGGQIAPPTAEPAQPPPDRSYMPAFARDAITYTPEQAKGLAAVLAGAAMSAIPGGGLLGRQAVNGATGAVMGAMEAEPGHRTAGAVTGGLLGLGAGAVGEAGAGLLNAALRRAGGRGVRVAKALVESTGLPADFEKLATEAKAARSAASETFFGPIDARGKIANPKIVKVLKESQVPSPDKPRSLKELQRLTGNLQRSNPAAADVLKATMGEEIPGLLDANAAYGPAARPYEAVKAGRKSYKTATDIRAAMQGMGPEESRNFAAARLHDIVAKLESHDEDAVGMLKQFMDAGPETKAQLETLFRGDKEGFARFMAEVRKERSAAKVAAMLPKFVIGVGGAGGAYGLLKTTGKF